MPSKCYSNNNETFYFADNNILNKVIKVQFLRFPPLLLANVSENEQNVRHEYCGPLFQLMREFAIKENVK
jgi:hypothetical protein